MKIRRTSKIPERVLSKQTETNHYEELIDCFLSMHSCRASTLPPSQVRSSSTFVYSWLVSRYMNGSFGGIQNLPFCHWLRWKKCPEKFFLRYLGLVCDRSYHLYSTISSKESALQRAGRIIAFLSVLPDVIFRSTKTVVRSFSANAWKHVDLAEHGAVLLCKNL